MKKIRLDVEELAVDSFDTASDREGRGTVRGNEPSIDEHSCWHGTGCWYPSVNCTDASCTCYENQTFFPCCEMME